MVPTSCLCFEHRCSPLLFAIHLFVYLFTYLLRNYGGSGESKKEDFKHIEFPA